MKLALALSIILAQEGVDSFSNSLGQTRNARAFVPFKAAATTTATTTTTTLWGILDELESDSYDLISSSKNEDTGMDISDAYEAFLAELVFSTNDPRVDIMNKFELAGDPAFIDWLQQKAQKSRDPEERIALKDLHAMIVDIKTRIEVNQLAEKRAKEEAAAAAAAAAAEAAQLVQIDTDEDEGKAMSFADVLKKAEGIAKAGMKQVEKKTEKKSFYEQEITPEIRLSYENLLRSLLPPYSVGQTPASIVFNNYDQFDAQLVKLLNERADNGDSDSAAILSALAVEQQKRIAAATETLKQLLAQGEPMKMEGLIIRLAREGKIDEAFLLLLEANENQAKQAGAEGPAQLMKRLRIRAMSEKDKQSTSKEIRLIRQLLRTEDSAEREKLLEDAFTPREALLVQGTAENARKAMEGEQPEQAEPMPDVPPPDFINACKAVLLNFGNLGSDGDERGDLATRIKKIASEAEVVATRIYGKGMTLREQQDRVWKEQTTSIFDLERMEIEAERMGEVAPWANPNADNDMLLPGFGPDGRMQIGGN